jgi:glucose/arabinose dehydrogenase
MRFFLSGGKVPHKTGRDSMKHTKALYWAAGGFAAVVVGGAVVVMMYYGYLTPFAPAGLVGGSAQIERVKLPKRFRIHVYARAKGARSLTKGPEGVVFVGSRKPGKVYALVDSDGDGKAEETKVIARGLNSPNGVAWRNGSLWIAEIGRVIKLENLAGRLDDPPVPKVINDSFPNETHHGWKFIAFGPDGKLYVPIGAPCNICRRADERFSTITRINPDGSGFEIFAHGIRNTVGFDWHPKTKVLWFTENGRDWMGDDRPPDELNRAAKKGLDFGFPGCHGRDVIDPKYGSADSCKKTVPPEVELGPHVAALGMRFYTGEMFPEKYRGGIFIAEHGSWNRSVPIGYRVMFVPINGSKAGKPEVFAKGWLRSGVAWGRPVDVEILPDGSMLVSDDKGGVIYRIVYVGRKPSQRNARRVDPRG